MPQVERFAADDAAGEGTPTHGLSGDPDHTIMQVAAFGDSAMWGQGLRREKRYTALILEQLPSVFMRIPVLSWDKSRSGAKIRPHGDDLEVFLDRFPSLFDNESQRDAFRAGDDLSPAAKLYGEIPAPFPTIRRQIDMMDADLGQSIELALLNGGFNDINVEDIINPQVSHGKFIERWDEIIRSTCYDDLPELLDRLRTKCPNAIIMYFGMFAPLSEQSSVKKLRDYLKFEADNDIGWWLNEHILHIKDVDALIWEAVTRSQWMRGRFHYWARKAVTDANQDVRRRGPGVLFVPSGFTNDQSVFGPTPFLHEEYIHPTSDAAQARRVKECPNERHLGTLRRLRGLAEAEQFVNFTTHQTGVPPDPDDTTTDERGAETSAVLAQTIDGPLKLKALVERWARSSSFGRSDAGIPLLKTVDSEISRIQTALIASVGHPNPLGARSYADIAIRRLTEHRNISIEIDRLEGHITHSVPGVRTLDERLRRFKLRTAGSLHADAGHLDVDSLAIRVVTATHSEANFRPDVWIVLNTRSATGEVATRNHRLNFRYRIKAERPFQGVTKLYAHFEPGKTNFFTIDPLRPLRLEEITRSALVVGPDPIPDLGEGAIWRPASIELEVNGVLVVSKRFPPEAQFGPDSRLELEYPGSF